jgi:hypothetical protein
MTDDIVKRLREKTGLELECVAMDAADRIEKLEKALRDTLAAWDYWQNCQEGNLVNGFSDLFANICEARSTLEENE